VPASSVADRRTTLGPFFDAPLERPKSSVEHLVNESCAFAIPEPTFTEKLRDGLPGLSVPVNVTFCVVVGAGGVGAGEATGAVADDTAEADPPLFEAVTTTLNVAPASTVCTV
jgi:hypothetical protein